MVFKPHLGSSLNILIATPCLEAYFINSRVQEKLIHNNLHITPSASEMAITRLPLSSAWYNDLILSFQLRSTCKEKYGQP